MPDHDARDSWIEVEVDLPNGAKVTGRTIPFRTGLKLKQMLYKFSETIGQKDFDALWTEFEKATGVTEARLAELCPSLTLLELTDFISRFIYVLRPGGTAAQRRNGTPDATAAPAAPVATVGSAASSPPSASPVS
jgi:hypothetical protein